MPSAFCACPDQTSSSSYFGFSGSIRRATLRIAISKHAIVGKFNWSYEPAVSMTRAHACNSYTVRS
eukprot:12287974-Heterocapsa_arctica.AAC.1